MSDNSQEFWSNDPYAPQISPRVYWDEKLNIAGFLSGSIFYGIVIALFFRCMATLLNPADRTRGGIKWGFVVHTALMFSIVTAYNADNLALQSLSYINNREYPGDNDGYPGPYNYQYIIYNKPISFAPYVMFILNFWLADGLLLYRCCVLYAMNYWVIGFPFLMYLVSLGMGIGFIYQGQLADVSAHYALFADFGKTYYSMSLSLDVLLTLMIVARMALHSRDIRSAMGSLVKPSKLYEALVTIIVESCALYTASYLLFLGPWASGSPVCDAFFPMLAANQVIAPFLITLRAASRRALTSGTIVSGDLGSICLESQGNPADSSETLPAEYFVGSMGVNGENLGNIGIGAATTIHEGSK